MATWEYQTRNTRLSEYVRELEAKISTLFFTLVILGNHHSFNVEFQLCRRLQLRNVRSSVRKNYHTFDRPVGMLGSLKWKIFSHSLHTW